MANFMRRLSGRGEDVGLPINTECSMTSKFKDIEEAWFEKSKKIKYGVMEEALGGFR